MTSGIFKLIHRTYKGSNARTVAGKTVWTVLMIPVCVVVYIFIQTYGLILRGIDRCMK